ncbi:hypothetical protein B4065_3612 [Caldibacillus thermoamylovorans]|uniref:Uncharacterized protein n=1 Tax=Caldibacillus thermoamylovorans TaxID=35841 RepID=A0ABD4AAG0_9BACI|nr:hypothetical protein B4065_3612 [Caldibacillus thermoamylovorans]KIO71188.1 hypothetical protein B4166_1378 [Caldibacillus thermoamylovorans]KIO73560.1 hypothetical protein B4167_1977 [Caldibacillus thermoamylovorans]
MEQKTCFFICPKVLCKISQKHYPDLLQQHQVFFAKVFEK